MRMDHQLYSSKYNLLKFIEIKNKNYLNMTMKKIYFIFVFSLISLLSSCSKTSEEEINLEGLNIVAPGIVRTPEERFMDLRDYPFQPNYMMIDGIRIHYLDEGPKEADPIILMHGLPTWSYLYRKMIPIFVKAGHRVIVPDMVGFGKSDKYIEKNDYSYLNHKELMKKLFINLDLDNITLMGQDWGGPIGLRVAVEMPEKFSRLIVSNGGLPSMPNPQAWIAKNFLDFNVWLNTPTSFQDLIDLRDEVSEINDEPSLIDGLRFFSKWIAHSYYAEDLDISGVMVLLGGLKNLSEEEKYAYEAPYPSSEYKMGANTFASFALHELAENETYWKDILDKWDKPLLVAFGENERTTYRLKQVFIDRVPNPTVVEDIKNAGHFIQEEAGEELAYLINDFIDGKL